MRTKTTVESKLDSFTPGYYDPKVDDFIQVSTDDEIAEFSKTTGVPVPVLRLIVDSLEQMAELAHDDLVDVWLRVNKPPPAKATK